MRCIHLNRVGEQCRDQAIQGSELCAYHAGILEDRVLGADDTESSQRRPRFPLLYRIAAALLLLLFLIEIMQNLRS